MARNGVDTRERILVAARQCFSTSGYAVTTNKDIAKKAGITTGAIYHYFDSKQELFLAVAEEVQQVVLSEFERAIARHDDFTGRLRAVLDASVELHGRDPWLARFVSVEPVEATRHKELRSLATKGQVAVFGFFERLVVDGQERGEVSDAVDPSAVASMIVAVTMGLALLAAVLNNADRHRAATEAFAALVSGGLLSPSSDRARGGNARSAAPARRA